MASIEINDPERVPTADGIGNRTKKYSAGDRHKQGWPHRQARQCGEVFAGAQTEQRLMHGLDEAAHPGHESTASGTDDCRKDYDTKLTCTHQGAQPVRNNKTDRMQRFGWQAKCRNFQGEEGHCDRTGQCAAVGRGRRSGVRKEPRQKENGATGVYSQ